MVLALAAVAAITAVAASAAVPYNQIVALEELFNSTGGPAWQNSAHWGVGDPCASGWFGVRCSQDGDVCVVCGAASLPTCSCNRCVVHNVRLFLALLVRRSVPVAVAA
jgi:hypothetical protein